MTAEGDTREGRDTQLVELEEKLTVEQGRV
jgi:dynein heavy chain